MTKVQNPKDLIKLKNPFSVRSVNELIRETMSLPVPQQLAGPFWVENEMAILFSSTNVGKSALAVQIADSISRGVFSAPFEMTAAPQKVLYIDLELSARQFTRRYTEYDGGGLHSPHRFSENFYRAEMELPEDMPEGLSMADYLIDGLEQLIDQLGTKCIILDNLSWLASNLEEAKNAGPLMQRLHMLKKKKEVSLLIVAHTPKREAIAAMTISSLAGSANIGNFVDSIFAVNRSQRAPNLRYVIQLKARNSELVYHSDNVATCRLEKFGSFLSYSFVGTDDEMHHLQKESKSEKEETDAQIVALRQTGKSYREIAEELNLHAKQVERRLKKMEQQCAI